MSRRSRILGKVTNGLLVGLPMESLFTLVGLQWSSYFLTFCKRPQPSTHSHLHLNMISDRFRDNGQHIRRLPILRSNARLLQIRLRHPLLQQRELLHITSHDH